MSEFKKIYINKQRDKRNCSIYPKFPKILKIDICNNCNYVCVFCPQSKQKSKVGCIDDELCRRLIKEAYEGGARELCLSMTGEPLLNKNLESYIKEAKEIGYKYVFFNTNGYLANIERGRKILESGVDSIKFSINASKKYYELIHGVNGFDIVINNLINMDKYRKEKEIDCKLYVSYIAVKQTINESEEVRKLLEPYVDDFVVMNANNRAGSIDEVEKFLYAGEDEFTYQYPCSQLFNNVYVTAEGYMIICCQDFENLTIVSDLNSENIIKAWNNEEFTNFRKKYLNKQLEGTLCWNCIYNDSSYVEPLNKERAYYPICEQKIKYLNYRIKEICNLEN